MPSKHISSISGDTEQHVSYHFDTIQDMIEFERFLQENTFEKYQQDQEISFDVAEAAIKKSLVLPENNVEIVSCEIKSRPWIIDWDKVEKDFGPEFKWFAVDEDVGGYVYNTRPYVDWDCRFWEFDDEYSRLEDTYILQKGTVPWNKSLVKKPEEG